MLARRLIAGRPRFQREPELVPVLSHLANAGYIPPLPGGVNVWDGFVNISVDGAPLFLGRTTLQQFGILGSEAPPASHLQKTITLLDIGVGPALFRCGAGGIDPIPLEILPYSSGGNNWCRHLAASVLQRPLVPGLPTMVDSGFLGVRNRRTNGYAELGLDNEPSGTPARTTRWVNNGDCYVGLQNLGLNLTATDTAAPPATYAAHGLTRQGSSGMLVVANRDIKGPPRAVIRELTDVTIDQADLRHEAFDGADVALTSSCTINTGLAAIGDNAARRQGRHYSIAQVVIVEVRRTPFGAPISFGGFSNLPCTLKIRATRRTGLLVVLPTGAVQFQSMKLERYAADVAAWQRTVSGTTGYVQAGGAAWPTLATNLPLTLISDSTIPTVARPLVMSDRLIEIVGSEIRMWGFDGTYLGANTIPSGVTVTRLAKTDLLWNRTSRWRTLDFGASWAQFDAGHADLFDGNYTSVQLY